MLGRVKEGLLDLETVTSKPPLFDLEPELEEAGAGEEEEVREETVTLSRLAPSGRAAIFASNSCSCCNALTKAAFNRFVCSAFKAFLTKVAKKVLLNIRRPLVKHQLLGSHTDPK